MTLRAYFIEQAKKELEKQPESIKNDATKRRNFIEEYLNDCIKKKYFVHRLYLNLEYNESILTFVATDRFRIGNFIIDYNKNSNKIRVFKDDVLTEPISLSDVIEYNLLDEGRLVCSCKKGDTKSQREFILNHFYCNSLELKIYYVGKNGSIITIEQTILEKTKRNRNEYLDRIELLKKVFNLFDSEILKYGIEKKEQSYNNGTEMNVYERLMELKKLYDAGIIDQATYEEKRKKFVDEL